MNRNVQALRALAAYAVVVHHILDSLANYLGSGGAAMPVSGASGVQIFFVISGYIIALSTARRSTTSKQFLLHRAIRVIPMYWVLTTVTWLALESGAHIFGHHGGVTARDVVTSYLFFPNIDWSSSKAEAPLLFVGWSLNYEIAFYLWFACAIALSSEAARLRVVTGGLLLLWTAQILWRDAYVDYWGHDNVLAFILGMWIWRYDGIPLGRSRWAPLAAIMLAVFGLAAPDIFPGLRHVPHRVLITVAAAGLLVGTAVRLERQFVSVGDGFLVKQGAASYSLYLVHPFVIQAIGKLSIAIGLNHSFLGIVITVTLMAVLSGIAGMLLFSAVEHPTTEWLRQLAQVPMPSVRSASARRRT